VKYVIGPDGSPLTIADLPAPGTKRWVIRRKAEEFLSWQFSIDQHGLAGLRTTRIQQYRQ
jgi:hypothetical protein